MERRKVICYEDELQDEFSRAQITPRKIDGSYRYDHTSPWKRFTRFFWYRIVATPIAFFYVKTAFGHRTVNKKCLRAFAKTGYFIYGNHTQDIADAFIPNLLCVRQESWVIVHPNNVSMPLLGKVVPSLGGLPLPDDAKAYANFFHAIEKRILQKHKVVIYPEAHIWPYYTHIRPFTDASFYYPVKLSTPVFCFTNTYQKRRFFKTPRIVTYIDGPFYPNASLPPRAQKKELRDRVYQAMCERAKNSTVEKIQYIKRKEENG